MKLLKLVIGTSAVALSFFAMAHNASQANEKKDCSTDIAVTPHIPSVCVSGSTSVVPQDSAAAFAWNAFFALNWPSSDTRRGEPDHKQKLVEGKPTAWETMRAKVELYPGNATDKIPPHGVNLADTPPYKPTNGPDFGFDEAPRYYYSPTATQTRTGELPACRGQQEPTEPSWIPLDETTQIGVNQTFAGASPATDPMKHNTSPQLIRYTVKMNRQIFQKIIDGRYWWHENQINNPLNIASSNYITALTKYQQSKKKEDPKEPYVNFVTNANTNLLGSKYLPGIEVKASWRPLSDEEVKLGRFHTTRVRYYEANDNGLPCYREGTWGLLGLHVLTASSQAGWMVWATFEQADNILTVDGRPTEDDNGHIVVASNSPPTTPALRSDPNQLNPVVEKVGDYCDNPGKRLFFRENPEYGTLPSAGDICVNRRWHAIPENIIKVNEQAHEALANYMSENGITSSPWMHYKLINVQPTPVDYTKKESANLSTTASYYLANSTIETDYSLGVFTGDLVKGVPSNLKTDADGNTYKYMNTQLLPFQGGKIGLIKNPMNMGGCAGCHAFAATQGRDFSFALGDNVAKPEATSPFAITGAARDYKR